MDAAIGLFPGFNARHLDAEQIANAFVPTPSFTRLLGVQNSLLVGARGSGKTHMLKMLQPKSLNAWAHEDAQEIRANIPYWGIFIPADEAWRQQILSTSESLSSVLQQKFRLAVFSTHVQRSLIDCFLQLTHDRPKVDRGFAQVDMPVALEYELCKTLASSWKLFPRVHSLIGVRQALVDRCADLYEIVEDNDAAIKLLDNCQTQAIQAALMGINAFDSAIHRFDGKWCLLFDELEIAPLEIQNVLLRSLRSSDQKLIFKLALSPSTQIAKVFQEALAPSSGNDFDEISLYTDVKESAYFCEQLWMKLANGTKAKNLHPASVLGHTVFNGTDTKSPYGRGGRWQEASTSLAQKDASYFRFLNKYGIDPDLLDKAPKKLKDSVIRKIGPVVGFRDFMYKWNPDKTVAVVRNDKSKPAQLYSGWEALCLVSEGNPRWFTGIARSLLIQREKSSSKRDLSNESQYEALHSASRKFIGYIATIPRPPSPSLSSTEGGLKSLIDFLVEQFRNEVLYKDFCLDPVLSFQVDANISEDVRQAIFDGLYSGAFIPVGDEKRQFVIAHDLVGLRLRPTYLLAPLEMLPLRTGKARKLTTLLKMIKANRVASERLVSKKNNVKSINNFAPNQELLFNE